MHRYRLILMLLMLLMLSFSSNLMAGPAFTERNTYIDNEILFSDSDVGFDGVVGALIALALSAYIGLGIGEAVKNFLHSKRPYGTGNELLAAMVTFISWGTLPVLLIIYWKQIILIVVLLIFALIVWSLKQASHGEASVKPDNKEQNSSNNKTASTDKNQAVSGVNEPIIKTKAESRYSSIQIVEKNDRAIHGRTEPNTIHDDELFKSQTTIGEHQKLTTKSASDDQAQGYSNGMLDLEKSKQPTSRSDDDAYDYKWWFDISTGQLLDTESNKRYLKSQIKVFANGYLIHDDIWVRASDVFVTD